MQTLRHGVVLSILLASCTSAHTLSHATPPPSDVIMSPLPGDLSPSAAVIISPASRLPIQFEQREVLGMGLAIGSVPFTKGVISPDDPYRQSPGFVESVANPAGDLVTFEDRDGDGFYSLGEDVKYQLGPALIGLADIKHAEATFEPPQFGLPGYWAVLLTFTSAGRAKLQAVTTRLVGRELAVVVNHLVVFAPTIQNPIAGGEAELTYLTQEGATTLADELNASIGS